MCLTIEAYIHLHYNAEVRKRIIYTLLAFLFFLGAVTFYINRVTLPRHLKSLVIESMEKYLDRKVAFTHIGFNPLRGLLLDGLVVYEDNAQDLFLTIDHAAVGFRYLPLITQRKIILSSMTLDRASVHFIHYAGDQWNFSDVVQRISHRREESSNSVPIYLSHVEMTHGKIKVTDLQADSQLSELFEDATIKADLSLSRGVGLEISTAIPHQQGWLEAKGRYHLFKKRLKGQIKMKNIPLADYLKVARLPLPWAINRLYINDAFVNITAGDQHLEAQGLGNVKDVQLVLPDDQHMEAGQLVLQKGELTWTNGQLNANAIAWVKDIRLSAGAKTLTAAGIQANLTGLSRQDNAFFAAGDCAAQKMTMTDSTTTSSFESDAILKNIRVSRNADQWTVNGAVQTQQTSVIFTPEVKLAGDFKSSFLEWSQSPKTVGFKGNLEGTSVWFQWPGKQLHGNITLQNFALNSGPQLPWTGQISAAGRNVVIDLPNGHRFATDMASAIAVKIQTVPARRIDVAANFQLKQSEFNMKNGVIFHGEPAGQLNVHADGNQTAAYEGSFRLEHAALENTRIDTITDISGTVGFKNDTAWTPTLSFVALGMPAVLKGRLQNFSLPSVEIRVNVHDFDLTQAPRFAPAFFNQNRLSLRGSARNLDVFYQGLISDAPNADVRFTAELNDAVATTAKFNQSASNLFGRIEFKKDYFAWKNLKASYNGRSYVLTGRLTNFKHPLLDTTLASRDLKLTTRIDYTPEVTSIKKLTGVYQHTTFDVTGSSRLSGDGRPLLNLAGDMDVDLKYLPILVPAWRSALPAHQLTGALKIKGSFEGDPIHWQDWAFNLTGGSGQIIFDGFKLRSVKFNAVQKNNRLKPLHIWGNFYGGEFNSIASVDLADPTLPFEFVLKLDNTDLRQLKADTPLKKHDIDGTLSATALLEGAAVDFKHLRGKGGVQITEGKLWELDLLKGLGGILLIPEYKDITFNEAGMNFTIKDGVMSTENLQLQSPSLTLLGRGTLDFDQNLHLVFSPDFNSDVIAGSSSLKKSSTAIIAQTEKFISVDVTGTLTKPQYKINKSPARILQKTGGVILENVSGFFKNIF